MSIREIKVEHGDDRVGTAAVTTSLPARPREGAFMALTELVAELATESLKSGDPPAELAKHVDYAVLTRDDRSQLLQVGLGALIGSELHARRSATSHNSVYRSRVDALHSEVRCTYTTHSDSFKKREKCVGHLLALPEEQKRIRVEEEQQRNAGYREAARTRESEYMAQLVQYQRAYAEAEVRAALESISLVGADGQVRTLFDFSTADVEHWRSRASSLAASWEEREAWFTDVAKALSDSGVERIGQLPQDQAQSLADRAIAIWKNAGREAS